jgi:hypothetical protein
VDASGTIQTSTDVQHMFVGSNGLFGIVTRLWLQLTPLHKLLALPRRVHDKHLKRELPALLADPHLSLIQWLPDVSQVPGSRSCVTAVQ